MKIKQGFVARKIGNETIVVPVEELSKTFHGMIKLNSTAAVIWQYINDGLEETEIVSKLLEKYDVTAEQADKAVKDFIEKLKAEDILE